MASVDNDNNQTEPESIPETFGRMLGQRREERGLSVEEMSAALRQTSTRVRAMEAGSWDELGPPVYARGYVGAYARELGVDPGPTVKYFEALEQQRLSREKAYAATRPRKPRLRRYHMLFAYVAATALVAIPVAYWVMHAFQGGAGGQREQSVASTPATPAAEQPLLASMAALPEIERGSRASAPELLLKFSKEVWIDARDTRGERLAYGLMAAGSERRLATAAGLDLRLGNADGVSAELGGVPFDLGAHTRDDAVELKLPAPDR